MADPSPPPQCKYFNLTYPLPFVAHVEINRPDKMNAFKEEMWHELPRLFSHLSTCPSTRAVILSGAGPKAFTTGLDIQEASSNSVILPNNNHPSPQSQSQSQPQHLPNSPPPIDGARTATKLRRHIDAFQSCITSIEKCEKPVVAALHGYCLGLGIDIAVCCDVRICAPGTTFAVKEVDIGIAADIGTLTRLPKVVGNGSWVKDVCLSGRMFGAVEAERVGFVSWVGAEMGVRGKEEVVEEAIRWAGGVVAKSPVAVQGTKELLNWGWNRSTEDGLRYTSVWNSAMLQGRDMEVALRAGIRKEKATFAKL